MMNIVLACVATLFFIYAQLSIQERNISRQKLDEYVSRQMLIDNGITDINKRITECRERNEKLTRMMWGKYRSSQWYLKLVKELKKRNEVYGIGGSKE
jgi:hypothetical protein